MLTLMELRGGLHDGSCIPFPFIKALVKVNAVPLLLETLCARDANGNRDANTSANRPRAWSRTFQHMR